MKFVKTIFLISMVIALIGAGYNVISKDKQKSINSTNSEILHNYKSTEQKKEIVKTSGNISDINNDDNSKKIVLDSKVNLSISTKNDLGSSNIESTSKLIATNDMNSDIKDITELLESKIMPKLTTKKQQELVELILGSMNTYINTTGYSIADDVQKAKELAVDMTKKERRELKLVIIKNVSIKNILKLNSYFKVI